MVKSGTLIDASLVEADAAGRARASRSRAAAIRDASWNAMPEKPLFGYKAHLAVDQGSGLVRRAILTPGQRLGQDAVPRLWCRATSRRCTPTKATTAGGIASGLAERGIADGVMAASYRRRRSMPADHARNRAHAPSSAGRAQLRDRQALVRLPPRALPLAVRNALHLRCG